jgi:cell wall-associated NlpC family hydrolase
VRFSRTGSRDLVPHHQSLRIAVAVAIGALVLLATAAAASADSIKDKQAQAQAIIAEIQSIDEEVGNAAEGWNGANLELQSLTTELAQTREDLGRARRLYKASQARIAERLRDLYVDGSPDSTLEVILGARSLDEVIAGLDATARIAAQDAEIARQAKAFRTRVTEREKQLSEAREKQAGTVEHLAAEKAAIEAKLAERQTLLGSVKDEIARMEAAERRRQAELRRQAQLELERQQRLAAAEAAQQAAAASAAAEAPGDADGDGASGAAPDTDYTPPPADASKGAQVVAIAMQYLGIPYVWGGASPSQGFDCSGLTMYVYAQIGISLPHYAAAQYQLGVPVSMDQLQPGDLVFFRGLGHMGMYIGGGNFIHAPHTGDVVKISPLSDSYYVANWVGARRVL